MRSWFTDTLGEPTPPQEEAWPLILAGRDVVVAAPTGSGKTMAAFLAALDDLARASIDGTLKDEVRVVYVSPLKALSNDVGKNLLFPLEGVAERLGTSAIRVAVRTGDTPAKERVQIGKRPPHVLVTTPESLFVLLGSESGQKLLSTAKTLILDEVHAVCGVRRGAHLAVCVERLDALVTEKTGRCLQRIGLSATQKPIELVAQFVSGAHRAPALIVDAGHKRVMDLAVEIPNSPLEAVMSTEVFSEVIQRLARLVEEHKTTIIFVNSRRMAERLATRLEDAVAAIGLEKNLVGAHHGSMSKDKRFVCEDRLKRGELRALVATSSLELGIDVGTVDLVCQLGSTKTIAAFLQRIGRAGHHKSLVPKGRLFPLSRDELAEAGALMHAIAGGELDALIIPNGSIDVVAQHAVAAVAAAGDDGLSRAALRSMFRRAWPFRDFTDERLDAGINLAADGVMTGRGRRGSWLFHDSTTDMLRPKRGARLAALTSGGVIPDMGDYVVIEQGSGAVVGTVNEDFAIESMAGGVFQLGASSWRVERVERGIMRVSDAKGAPPNIPFWLGEAPGRSLELSAEVAVMRQAVEDHCVDGGCEATVTTLLTDHFGLPDAAARQLADYLCAARVALGHLPTQKRIIVERFEDSLGGTQLVIHAPFGSRITRAWGLALRKKFCRSFDFELQAAATEDGILLSVGAVDGVDLQNLVRFVTSKNLEETLIQAILQAPLFGTRFRWNVTRSLTVLRNRSGKRVPPGLLRIEAEDVLVSLFPDSLACPENLGGDREVPDDILVKQTLDDCMREAMDVDGARRLLLDLESGVISVTTVERAEPSPLALELVGARPYAFLDDVPLEERRVQAVMSRRSAQSALEDETQALDAAVVADVLDEVRPRVRSEDEAWDLTLLAGFLRLHELAPVGGPEMPTFIARLVDTGRIVMGADGTAFVAVEHKELLEAPTHELLMKLMRGRLELLAPISRDEHRRQTPVPPDLLDPVLERIVREGAALEGTFDATRRGERVLWSRRLVARARRRMLERLRAEIEPVQPADLMRSLFERHRFADARDEHRFVGRDGVRGALKLLDGVTAPAAAWEQDLLPSRVRNFDGADVDALCLAGELTWRCRSTRAEGAGPRKGGVVRQTALTLADRDTAAFLPHAGNDDAPAPVLSETAQLVVDTLTKKGPSFFRDLARHTALATDVLEAAVAENIAAGLVTADGFAAVRGLVRSAKDKEKHRRAQHPRLGVANPFDVAGRFALVDSDVEVADADDRAERHARLLLQRFGVVFRTLVERDPLLPPWRDLLLALRRLEVRGEVRGGRFVHGFSGEQFAEPDALANLRRLRQRGPEGKKVVVAAADPLNLTGIVLPGARIPAVVGHKLLFVDGLLAGVCDGDGVRIVESEVQAPLSIDELTTLLTSTTPKLFLARG